MLKQAAKKCLDLLGISVSRKTSSNVERELALYERLYSERYRRDRRFYNVGAGSFSHPYWTNIDFVSDHYAAVQKNVVHHDLMTCGPLPIESNSAAIIYTSHTIEHVSDAAVENLFREAYRALEPGGGLRVTTGPDAKLDHAALERGDDAYFYWDEYYVAKGSYETYFHAPATSVPLEERWLHHVASQLAPNDISKHSTKLDAAAVRKLLNERGLEPTLDYLTSLCTFDPTRPGNHISWWTHDKAMALMRSAGFETVYPSAYGQSRFPVLRDTRYFDNTHPSMSLYVEAIKG